MRYRLEWVRNQDIAWTRIDSWGYPTQREEFDNPVMVEVGKGAAYFWYEFLSREDALLHMAANPEHRCRFMTKHTVTGLKMCAELLGARHIWVFIEDQPEIDAYVERLGFVKIDEGWRWSI